MATQNGSPAQVPKLSSQGYSNGNASCSESSDEDDDGIPSRIPSISPSKPIATPSAPSDSARSNLKRSYNALAYNRRSSFPDTRRKLALYPGLSKKQKLEHWADNQRGRMPLTPISSRTAHMVIDAPSRNESAGSGTDDDVPAIVLDALNSASRPTFRAAPEQPERPQSQSSNYQPSSETSREGQQVSDIMGTRADAIDEGGEQGVDKPSGGIEMVSAGLDQSANRREPEFSNNDAQCKVEDDSASVPKLEYPLFLGGSKVNNIASEAREEEHGISTQAHVGHRDTQSPQQPPAIDQVTKSQISPRRSKRLQATASQSQQALKEYGEFLSAEDEGNQNNEGDEDYEPCQEVIEGLEDNGEVNTDVDLSVEESFEQDVIHFKSLHVEDRNVKDFEGPSDDDLVAIPLDYEPVQKVCKLLGHSAWAAKKIDWQWRPFNCDYVSTLPGRKIVSLLVKLERLYHAAPVAPELAEQNRFLREHSGLLSYYFSKIRAVVDYIGRERLASLEQNTSPLNTCNKHRKEMAQDLVQTIIPMLLHVFASAWRLGGRIWTRTSSFTRSTVELLQREVCWVMLLYPSLLKELGRSPLEERPEAKTKLEAWEKRVQKREELHKLLEKLSRVVQDAPGMLEKEEKRAHREMEERKQWLKRQKEIQAQRKLEEEAKLAYIRDQKLRSLMSIRGVHYPLRATSSSPSASSSATRTLPKSPTPSYKRSKWSFEERVFLFEKIQESYPVIPDLESLHLEVGKTVEEMEDMAEELLGVMLKAAKPDDTAESRRDEVSKIMQSYRMAHGRRTKRSYREIS
ncbi:hypothetical protein F5X96DRAFT_646769 [Biscogniauxia mediterranea]|nr:hypothetical protein F5X96DRAFT_646769 [Biscogniauxia mediterranea]